MLGVGGFSSIEYTDYHKDNDNDHSHRTTSRNTNDTRRWEALYFRFCHYYFILTQGPNWFLTTIGAFASCLVTCFIFAGLATDCLALGTIETAFTTTDAMTRIITAATLAPRTIKVTAGVLTVVCSLTAICTHRCTGTLFPQTVVAALFTRVAIVTIYTTIRTGTGGDVTFRRIAERTNNTSSATQHSAFRSVIAHFATLRTKPIYTRTLSIPFTETALLIAFATPETCITAIDAGSVGFHTNSIGSRFAIIAAGLTACGETIEIRSALGAPGRGFTCGTVIRTILVTSSAVKSGFTTNTALSCRTVTIFINTVTTAVFTSRAVSSSNATQSTLSILLTFAVSTTIGASLAAVNTSPTHLTLANSRLVTRHSPGRVTDTSLRAVLAMIPA